MEKLTFKQYLETKEKLREALSKIPKQSITYSMTKYCKMIVGEKDEKIYIPLKPKDEITVEFLYEDETNPTVLGVNVTEASDADPDEQYNVFWESERFVRWLDKNAKKA